MSVMQRARTQGNAAANGVQMYWRSVGEGGTPHVVVHGGFGLGQADLLGDALGAQASLRAAISHPDRVRRLVSVSGVFRRDGWFREVLEARAQVNGGMFEQFRHSPPYAAYAAVAPDVDAFPILMDDTGALLARPYDWTEEVRGMTRDAGWDGAQRPASRLAILPGRTHYVVAEAPELPGMVAEFLA